MSFEKIGASRHEIIETLQMQTSCRTIHGAAWRAAVVALALATAGCAAPVFKNTKPETAALAAETRKQEIALLRYRLRQSERLRNIAYPVYLKGTAMCGEIVKPAIGFRAATPQHFIEQEREAATEAFALGNLPVVIDVATQSPAARAGVQAGDIVLEFDDAPIVSGAGAKEDYKNKVDAYRTSKSQVFNLVVRRAGKQVSFSIRPDILCDYPVLYQSKEIVNASANGKLVFIAAGMMRFADNDSELATVIAHELAHNTMRHIQKQQTNQTAGAAAGLVLDILAAVAGVNTQGAFSRAGGNIAGRSYSQEFEAEADYVGLYYLARAGYEIDDAANLWRRMGAIKAKVEDLSVARTHPTSAERFLRLEEATKEIKAKIAAGKPLLPELEKEPPWLQKAPSPSETDKETPSS